ncbi:MAG TPA: polymer-forming cytoskeletal protein [Methanocorpusculum sp.]|nr:polymer-forming cytoskeletal protein [Methanocorpusculum sp.]
MIVFVKDNLYMAEKGAYFRESVKIDGDFLVPKRTIFWKDVVVSGSLYLCPECTISGNVSCNGAVIGPGSVIKGEFNAGEEQLTVCDNAAVRLIKSTGNVLLRDGVQSNEVHAENLLIMGKVRCNKLMGKKTKVISN